MEYTSIEKMTVKDLMKAVNRKVRDGWRLFSVVPSSPGTYSRYYAIMEREKPPAYIVENI